MPLSHLQKHLLARPGKKLQVKINDNRSTMLSVKWEPDCTKVSLHRIFLSAPQNVMEELACYIRREKKAITPSVKAFIEDNLQKLDYSHQLDSRKLHHQGNVYNLREIMDDLNAEYFGKRLNLYITWWGKPHIRNRSRITFGLYYDPLRLIKINRMMDSPSFPEYVVSYVIYHEMLHHVCPSYVDEKGLSRIHNKKFKEREALFRHFDLAQSWIKEHQAALFEI